MILLTYIMSHVNRIITLTWYLFFSRKKLPSPSMSGTDHRSDVTCNDIYFARKNMHTLLQLGFSTAFWLGPGNPFSSLNQVFLVLLHINSFTIKEKNSESSNSPLSHEQNPSIFTCYYWCRYILAQTVYKAVFLE